MRRILLILIWFTFKYFSLYLSLFSTNCLNFDSIQTKSLVLCQKQSIKLFVSLIFDIQSWHHISFSLLSKHFHFNNSTKILFHCFPLFWIFSSKMNWNLFLEYFLFYWSLKFNSITNDLLIIFSTHW